VLISIDGIDGCGKSTQVGLLAEDLGARRIQEISDSVWGRRLRALESPTLGQQLAYFTADRALLSPTLAEASGSPDVHVVSDRSYLSSVAYQSYESPLTPELLEEIGLTLMPPYDLQLVLRIPAERGLARVQQRGEAMTWCETPERLTWCARIFDRWAAKRQGIASVDALGTIEEVHARVMAEVERVSRAHFGRVVW